MPHDQESDSVVWQLLLGKSHMRRAYLALCRHGHRLNLSLDLLCGIGTQAPNIGDELAAAKVPQDLQQGTRAASAHVRVCNQPREVEHQMPDLHS